METREARALLQDVQFPGDEDPTYVLAVSGSNHRKQVIRQNDERAEIAAAVEIQRWWRGYYTRNRIEAIITALATSNSEEERLPIKGRVWTRTTAATAIQTAWRSYNNRKLFSYYRNIINFHGFGNPAMMLRTINPKEATLLDKASGGFVRFRLGGTEFPPKIYYKIYTCQSVVDMGTFSPRDYTAYCEKRQTRNIHNRGEEPTASSHDNWYKRIENNGWRPVVQNLYMLYMRDEVTAESSSKAVVPFHHLKTRRREDILRERKRRKVEWMKKLYQRKCDDDQTMESNDDDVEELLQWTNELDFDLYMSEWQILASTGVCQDPFTIKIETMH